MPADLEAEELAVEGEDAEVADEALDEEPVEESPLAPPQRAANPLDQMVPLDRFNEVTRQLQETRDLVNQLAGQRQAPAAPATPSYARPTDPEDVRKLREFVGQTVDPVVNARFDAMEQQFRANQIQLASQASERDARSTFPDYETYAPDIERLRQEFARSTGVAVRHREAYLVVKGEHELKRAQEKQRSAAVRRVAPAASTSSRPPASGPRPTGAPRTPADVAKLTSEQVEKLALGGNLPV